MPLLMMVETKEEKVSFYEPMEEITGDLIADWVDAGSIRGHDTWYIANSSDLWI